jgi:hypothetical protein
MGSKGKPICKNKTKGIIGYKTEQDNKITKGKKIYTYKVRKK